MYNSTTVNISEGGVKYIDIDESHKRRFKATKENGRRTHTESYDEVLKYANQY